MFITMKLHFTNSILSIYAGVLYGSFVSLLWVFLVLLVHSIWAVPVRQAIVSQGHMYNR